MKDPDGLKVGKTGGSDHLLGLLHLSQKKKIGASTMVVVLGAGKKVGESFWFSLMKNLIHVHYRKLEKFREVFSRLPVLI